MVGESLDPDFGPLLRSFGVRRLDGLPAVIFGLWPDLRIAYLNRAWFSFARENGGEPAISTRWCVGSTIRDAMSSELLVFYLTEYERCLGTLGVWSHEYECSSDELYRRYHQIAYPLGKGEGLLIVNSLVVERPHDPTEMPARALDERAYRGVDGLIRQCSHCRRVRRLGERETWDWVPAWVRSMPARTSHTICPTCFSHYYPRSRK